MSRPKRSDAYPASMMQALTLAFERGSLLIPVPPGTKPAALRLHFYGLFGALRAEGKPEFPDALAIVLSSDPPGILISPREFGNIGSIVAAALVENLPRETPPSEEPAENLGDMLSRILGDKT